MTPALAALLDLHGPGLWGAMAAFGLLVGLLTGLFGVGGGFMIVPLLKLLFGIPYPVATGSSLSFTIGSGAAGMARHLRLGNVEVRAMILMGAGAILGAWLGKDLQGFLATAIGSDGKAGFNMVMDGLFIGLLLLTAFLIWSRKDDEPTGTSLLQRLRLGPRIDLPKTGLVGVSAAGLVLIGVLVGGMTGLLGIGGGVLFMPLLILVVGLRPHQAVGTSLGVVLFGSISGTIGYGLRGDVDLPIVVSLLIGSTVGIQIGAALCQRLHAARLRRYFVMLVLAVVVWLAWNFIATLAGGNVDPSQTQPATQSATDGTGNLE
ncbi:MAG TPA: sulfite exporter TauE/SafE family protein [Phycisphaerae bacterium]|nr:sulfite exporter TauE/SafE family protein [Phycisphaerae bacterium]